jgi:hypothetical protein
MRKITEDAHEAFNKNKRFSSSNTVVTIEDDATNMYLFGNHIAKKIDDELYISDGNYGTSLTTRDRLSGFRNVHLRINKGEWILNEKQKWDGEWINVNNL